MKLRIGVTVQQRQTDGSNVKIEFGGRAIVTHGSKEQIAKMLLEAEMHGNSGKSRIHISMAEEPS